MGKATVRATQRRCRRVGRRAAQFRRRRRILNSPRRSASSRTRASGSIACRARSRPGVRHRERRGITDQFLRIVDLNNPGEPVEVGRWWYPGMYEAAGAAPDFHRGVGTPCIMPFPTATCRTARGGMPGLVILDIADPTRPQFVSNLNLGTASQRRHPHRPAVAWPGPRRGRRRVDRPGPWRQNRQTGQSGRRRLDPYSPVVLSSLPLPGGASGTPAVGTAHTTCAELDRERAGPQAGCSSPASTPGCAVFDLADPTEPKEVAHFVPDPRPGVGVPPDRRCDGHGDRARPADGPGRWRPDHLGTAGMTDVQRHSGRARW